MKISGIYAPSLRPKQRRCKKAVKTTIMVDSTIKGTTYKGENREKKRGIYEKRKLIRGDVERIEKKRVEENIRREKRK